MSAPEIVLMPLSKITVDLSVSSRVALPADTIENYAEALKRGEEFPPVVAFRAADRTFLADGFLRHAAHVSAGIKSMSVEVRPGGWREARMFAASARANGRHGLPRTGPCRRLAVMFVLCDEEGKTWTQNQVAMHVGVSTPLVRAVQQLVREGATPEHVAGAKLSHSMGGWGMPQTPAAVVGRDPQQAPAVPPAVATPAAPVPPPVPPAAPPPPRPAAPKPPPASVDPWVGALDGKRDEPEQDDFEDGPDEEDEPAIDDEESARDVAQTLERCERSCRKYVRFARRLGLDPHDKLDLVVADMVVMDARAARRGRPEKPPCLTPPDEAD